MNPVEMRQKGFKLEQKKKKEQTLFFVGLDNEKVMRSH